MSDDITFHWEDGKLVAIQLSLWDDAVVQRCVSCGDPLPRVWRSRYCSTRCWREEDLYIVDTIFYET